MRGFQLYSIVKINSIEVFYLKKLFEYVKLQITVNIFAHFPYVKSFIFCVELSIWSMQILNFLRISLIQYVFDSHHLFYFFIHLKFNLIAWFFNSGQIWIVFSLLKFFLIFSFPHLKHEFIFLFFIIQLCFFFFIIHLFSLTFYFPTLNL